MLGNKSRTWWGAWSCTAIPNPQSLWHFPRWRMFNGVSLSGIQHTLLSTALSITSPHILSSAVTHPFLYIPTNKPHRHPCSLAYAVLRRTCLILSEMPDSSLRLSDAPDVTSFQILIPSCEDCRLWPQVLVICVHINLSLCLGWGLPENVFCVLIITELLSGSLKIILKILNIHWTTLDLVNLKVK